MWVNKFFNRLKHLNSTLDCGGDVRLVTTKFLSRNTKHCSEGEFFISESRIIIIFLQRRFHLSDIYIVEVKELGKILHWFLQSINKLHLFSEYLWICQKLWIPLITKPDFLFYSMSMALKLVLYCSHHNWKQEFLLYQSFGWGLAKKVWIITMLVFRKICLVSCDLNSKITWKPGVTDQLKKCNCYMM